MSNIFCYIWFVNILLFNENMYNLEEQIAEFYQFKILNPKKEETFDNLTKLAAITCGTQYSVINFRLY